MPFNKQSDATFQLETPQMFLIPSLIGSHVLYRKNWTISIIQSIEDINQRELIC